MCIYIYMYIHTSGSRIYRGATPTPGINYVLFCSVYTMYIYIYIYICIGNPSLFDLGEISAFEAGPRLEINVFMYFPLRPIHLLRVVLLRVLAARFGGRHFCHRMNLRVSSRG